MNALGRWSQVPGNSPLKAPETVTRWKPGYRNLTCVLWNLFPNGAPSGYMSKRKQ